MGRCGQHLGDVSLLQNRIFHSHFCLIALIGCNHRLLKYAYLMEKSELCKMWLTWGLRTSRPPDILVDFVKVSTQTAFQLCHMEGRDRFFCRKLVYQHVQHFCSRFIFLCENILVKNGIWRTPYRERCSN